MATHSEYSRDSYPANKRILQKVGGIKAHLLCRIYWATNLKDGVCRMGLTRLGDEIGFGRSTVGRAAKELVADGYIKKVKEADPANMEPPHYQVTQKFYDLLAVSERDTPSQSGTPRPTKGHPPVPERDEDIDSSLNIDTEDDRQKFDTHFLKLGHAFTTKQANNAVNAALVKHGINATIAAYERAIENGAENVGIYAAGILRRGGVKDNNNTAAVKPPETVRVGQFGGMYI